MLRERLGDARFHQMQVDVLRHYAGKPITNEQFREAASIFVPPGQPDPKLTAFFETWVYGTGLPEIRKSRSSIEVKAVEDDFTFDVPLSCKSLGGNAQTRWLRVTEGQNPLPGTMANCQLPSRTDFLYMPSELKAR
jgi:hypothetical protein